MSIRKLSPGKWEVRVRTHVEGKTVGLKRTVSTQREARIAEAELLKEVHTLKANQKRSLTITKLSEALSFYRENTSADLTRVETYFNRLEREMGSVLLYELPEKFSKYLQMLKRERAKRTGNLLSPVTINKLLVYAKTALSFCMKRGLIDKNPLQHFSKLPEEGRDRILSVDEKNRLIATLERNNSYLLWPVKFSLKNPIRKGDLIALTRENFDRFNHRIHFYASKTRKRKNRKTVLIFLDDELIKYFDSLPADCPYLFPRIDQNGNWYQMGDMKRHWHTILREAKIEDFHWHDLKHQAITWMMDNEYNEHDLRGLGIQYSPAMIARYYHHDVNEVLQKKKRLESTPEQQQKNASC